MTQLSENEVFGLELICIRKKLVLSGLSLHVPANQVERLRKLQLSCYYLDG